MIPQSPLRLMFKAFGSWNEVVCPRISVQPQLFPWNGDAPVFSVRCHGLGRSGLVGKGTWRCLTSNFLPLELKQCHIQACESTKRGSFPP